ncbi:MAG: cysteine desulfurase NifS [Oscillospiraceae bacterium]|nr:cysteine desulfurase NifS [Oscillospiraceae bacterium]MCI6972563.1 cysteine desulfurase NifS [Clostridiales bacterium]MDY2909559.1 cysteine desulfurase NifS [Oscillospiraceae bacterium]
MFVYADNAATTAVSKTALDAMMPYLTDYYGNPSSLYAFAQKAKEALEEARATVASIIGAEPREIYFTSGGSEADNQAIVSMAKFGALKGKKHLISTKFEHHAVLHTLKALEKQGFEVTLLDVHEDGIVRLEDLEAAIREDTALVTIMFANNEIGTIQPIKEIGELCRSKGIPFHTDAVQAMGHIPVNVKEMNIDLLSMSGHKFHAPKGVGVLYAKRGLPLFNIIEGGAQERGKRAGTENIPGIVALAAALKESVEHMEENTAKIIPMRDKLFAELSKIPHSKINGSLEHHVPGTVNMCFEGIEGESLLLLLDSKGICASSGSACTSGSLDPSHVLLSIGLPHEVAHGSLRLSIGEYNTMEEIDHIIESVPPVVEYLRSISPVWEELENGTRKHLI